MTPTSNLGFGHVIWTLVFLSRNSANLCGFRTIEKQNCGKTMNKMLFQNETNQDWQHETMPRKKLCNGWHNGVLAICEHLAANNCHVRKSKFILFQNGTEDAKSYEKMGGKTLFIIRTTWTAFDETMARQNDFVPNSGQWKWSRMEK